MISNLFAIICLSFNCTIDVNETDNTVVFTVEGTECPSVQVSPHLSISPSLISPSIAGGVSD